MKKILFLLTATLALCSQAADFSRDYRAPQTFLDLGTAGATIGNGATLSPTNGTGYVTIYDVNGSSYVGIQCNAIQLNGAGTNSPTIKFAKSVDGTTFETTPSITLAAVTLNGTTAVNTYDAVSTEGVKSLKLVSVVNGVSGQAITNLVIKFGYKTPVR